MRQSYLALTHVGAWLAFRVAYLSGDAAKAAALATVKQSPLSAYCLQGYFAHEKLPPPLGPP